jgi:sarcosine oxidase subunit gamma
MSDVSLRRHGLETFFDRAPTQAGHDSGATITIRDDLGHINLRGGSIDKAFVAAVEDVLQQSLPLAANTMTQEAYRVFWLGPDEWLVVTAAQQAAEVTQALQQATSDMHASVNDLSGGQVALQLTGRDAIELLSKGCTLDLHPDVFRAGDCAQSGLAKANILLGLVDEAPTFLIGVRRSFADYLCHWLAHAGRESGIEFSEQ